MTLPALDPLQLAAIAVASFVAFVVRGLSGFGSSMIGIGALSTVLPPAQVVPAFLGLEVLTSLNLLPGTWRQIDWRSLRWVVAGCAITTPIGLLALAHLDPNAMRLTVSACLMLIALLMLSPLAARLSPRSTPGPLGAMGVGGLSGLLNGAAGIGGPPAIVFYFSSTGAAVSRATLIAFFLFTDLYALGWAGSAGMLQGLGWSLIALALPFSLLGIWVGQRLFVRLDEARLRRLIWCLLALLGACGLANALWRMA